MFCDDTSDSPLLPVGRVRPKDLFHYKFNITNLELLVDPQSFLFLLLNALCNSSILDPYPRYMLSEPTSSSSTEIDVGGLC